MHVRIFLRFRTFELKLLDVMNLLKTECFCSFRMVMFLHKPFDMCDYSFIFKTVNGGIHFNIWVISVIMIKIQNCRVLPFKYIINIILCKLYKYIIIIELLLYILLIIIIIIYYY